MHTFLVFLTEKKVTTLILSMNFTTKFIIIYFNQLNGRFWKQESFYQTFCLYKSSRPELILEKADLWYFQFNRRRILQKQHPITNSFLEHFVNFHISDGVFIWRAASDLFHVSLRATVWWNTADIFKTTERFTRHSEIAVKSRKYSHGLKFFKGLFCWFIYKGPTFGGVYWLKSEFEICWTYERDKKIVVKFKRIWIGF